MKMMSWLALGLATVAPASSMVATGAGAQTGPAFVRSALTKPILYLRSLERYQTGAGTFVSFTYEVTNRSAYPAAMFTLNSNLPPCGANPNASRTWVDFYNAATNQRIYGYCALTSPDKLGKISFSLPEGTAPPRAVYIVIYDRARNLRARSNNEITVLTPPPSG